MNITETFAHHARAVPDRPALVHGERIVLFRDLDRMVSQTGAFLYSLGLQPGDVCGVALRDSIEHILILCGLARAGIVLLPLDWRWTPVEQKRVLSHFGANMVLMEPGKQVPGNLKCVFIDSEFKSRIEKQNPQIVFPEGDIPLLMSLSSGTTGRAKGPRLRHSQFLARYRVFWINLGFNSQDRFLSATPLYYGGGRTFPLAMLYAGGTTFMLPPPYEPEELCEMVAKHRISSVFLVPTLIRRLLTLPEARLAPIRSLRLLLSSGSALHADERRLLRALCPGFIEYYSSTEGGGVSYLTSEDPERFSESVGRPVFGVEVQCVDEDHLPLAPGAVGRIRYRGPAVADGFWNDPEASRESFRDGWWYPGDLGMLDEHGYLYLKGRAKDMIIRGGINIYPAEVEAVLQSHPAVADSAVVGWPSREFNEEIAAFVILKDGAQEEKLAAELRDLCRGRMAPYKVPREVFVVKDFPRNALGKVIKADLSSKLPSL
ncbi:MAG TPA: AMP-binding protein [Burkholderiales bacterium]|nr:AMP-binding protein [Burkholderiales bacterium]